MPSILDIINEELAGASQSAANEQLPSGAQELQAPEPPPEWNPIEEQDFKEWYKGWSEETGLNPNPDDPGHFYDYRAAYRAGAYPQADDQGVFHWPSAFKLEGHPNMVVGGVNTKTGQPVTPQPQEPEPTYLTGGATAEMQMGQQIPGALSMIFGGGETGEDPFGAKSFEQFGRMATRSIPQIHKTWNDLLYLAPLAKPEETPAERMRRQVAEGGVGAVTPPSPVEDPEVRASLLAAEPEIRENVRVVNDFFPEVLKRKPSIAEQILTAPAGFLAPMAVSALSGGAGLALTFMTAYGNAMEDLEKQGVKEDRAREAAMFIALTTTPLEFAGNLVQIGAMKSALGFAKNPVKKEAIELGEAMVQSAIAEGTEEFLQQYFEVAGLYYAANPTMSPKDVADYIFKTFDKQTLEALKAGGIGAASGAMLTGATVGGGKALQEFVLRKDEKQKDKLISDFEKRLGVRAGAIKENLETGKPIEQIVLEELEEEFLPKPVETTPKEMGAVPGEEAGMPPSPKPPAEEELEEIEPEPVFASMQEAQTAGLEGTEEQAEQWRELRQEKLDEADFFNQTSKNKEAAAAIKEAAKYARAIEAYEQPDRFSGLVEKPAEEAPEAVAAKPSVPEIPVAAPTRKTFEEQQAKPAVAKSYGDVSQEAKPFQNILVQPKGKEGKQLLVQIAPSVARPEETEEFGERYFDKLYQRRAGYVRPEDFWEVPGWITNAAKNLPDSDVMVVRNPVSAAKEIKESGYDAIMFSAMDVNKQVIKQIASEVGPSVRVIVGGYVDKSYFKDAPNVEFHDSLESAYESLGRTPVPGVDTRHFQGTPTIPRLCLSKGCLHKCAFCTVPKGVKPESAESIDAQLEGMKGLKFSLVYLDDKTFGQAENYGLVKDLFTKIKEFNPEFQGFVVQTTAPQLLKFDDEFLQSANIKFVELGVESYNDEILAKIHKPARTKTIDAAVEKLRANKIAFVPNIMVGLPGETKQTYLNTLAFLRKNDDAISHVNIYNLAAYKGTEIAGMVEAREDLDLNENVVERSYLKNPKLHKSFADAVTKFAEKQLDTTPYTKQPTVERGRVEKTLVSVPAVTDKGKKIVVKMPAQRALQDIESKLNVYRSILECLTS
jgi:hypothetical protein